MGLNRFDRIWDGRGRLAAALALILLAGAGVQGASYWPGIMTWDSVNQYGQVVKGAFDDWHPPVMAWLWRRLIRIAPGPAPMFVMQLALYWAGYALIAAAALRRRQPVATVLIVAVALLPFPLALMGSVQKDCLMEGCLLTGIGLLAWIRSDRDWPLRIAAAFFLLFVTMLRFNAFLAVVPLLVWLVPMRWRRTPLRIGAIATAWLALSLLAMPAANRLIGAQKSHVALSLMIFDLGGITRNSGQNMFPPLGVRDPVAVNARCYKPDQWDSYSYWVDEICPINFYGVEEAMENEGASAYPTLLRAALTHPIAYAEHRFAHFNINSRFLVHDEIQPPALDASVPNDWHFAVDRNPGLRGIFRLAEASTHSPLGWPIWWIALAGGLLALSPSLPSRALIVPIALSSFLYGLGYLPLSVSSELRYHLWTITGTAIAAAFALADVRGGARPTRGRVIASLAPALLVGLLCTLWRLT